MNTTTRTAARGLTLLALAALTACANLAPDYTRPEAPVPTAWPQAASHGAASLPDGRDFVADARLRRTIELALGNSRSLRLALLAIEQARAAYRIEAADRLPTLKASGSQSASRTPAEASTSGQVVHSRSYSANVGIAAFEIDLFGRVRNLSDAALESFLATEEAARSTRIALVAEVATAWLTLQADQQQLALARRTLDSQRSSYELTRQRHALGADSALTLAQAQTTVEAARRDAAAYEASVAQDLNALRLLVGTDLPADCLPAGEAEADAAALVAVPGGLPSALLQRRPDVLAAEHKLKAANADVGAARAALFPTIQLTAATGTASRSLGELFEGRAWSFAPSISLPIFDGGAARAGVDQARATQAVQLASYEQTLQTAFREVADALAVRATIAERLDAQTALVAASERAWRLADARWKAGAASYLDALDAQRTLYAAQQTLVTLRLAEQSNRVRLFEVLGGEWDAAGAPAAS
ncbi:efflux transporter outer membrane subunit [Rubrivivax gelatinosus]|uniref:Outer membrane efflux protein n=1 Tax=Rubrivivax gelatinosus (strain NBRC 100245 / IL144) TaxID=983917 RepID=I0HMK5_RUBGI|nr:efflux transporter outer membrane subunit [Rubrivivax gelatinosus]BAL94242.1 outer membrane efflux protein [Rubrivivax gelatinosus IL144]